MLRRQRLIFNYLTLCALCILCVKDYFLYILISEPYIIPETGG
jgi:hypothetical protein